MSRIHVTIDKLVLRGVEASERQALIDGLRAGLAAALADQQSAARARPASTSVLRLGSIPAERGPAGRRGLRPAGRQRHRTEPDAMTTGFTNSPRLVRGGIVTMDPDTSAIRTSSRCSTTLTR